MQYTIYNIQYTILYYNTMSCDIIRRDNNPQQFASPLFVSTNPKTASKNLPGSACPA